MTDPTPPIEIPDDRPPPLPDIDPAPPFQPEIQPADTPQEMPQYGHGQALVSISSVSDMSCRAVTAVDAVF